MVEQVYELVADGPESVVFVEVQPIASDVVLSDGYAPAFTLDVYERPSSDTSIPSWKSFPQTTPPPEMKYP